MGECRGQRAIGYGGINVIASGQALQSAGMQNNGQTVEKYGVGSSPVQGTYWSELYVAPQSDPKAYIIANQTEPSGLGSAVTNDGEDEIINIGGQILDQGTFMVNGTSWTWTYTPQQ